MLSRTNEAKLNVMTEVFEEFLAEMEIEAELTGTGAFSAAGGKKIVNRIGQPQHSLSYSYRLL